MSRTWRQILTVKALALSALIFAAFAATVIPRELICAGRPERRGRVSTRAGVSGLTSPCPRRVAVPAAAGPGTG
jgi:hypothetical protein